MSSSSPIHELNKKNDRSAYTNDDEEHARSVQPRLSYRRICLRMDKYWNLDPKLIKNTEYIVNVPYGIRIGELISIAIEGREIKIECPVLGRREDRFIVCFEE